MLVMELNCTEIRPPLEGERELCSFCPRRAILPQQKTALLKACVAQQLHFNFTFDYEQLGVHMQGRANQLCHVARQRER